MKSDIPTNYVTNSALTTKLNSYATTTSITTVDNKHDNYITKSWLTTKLNNYALKTDCFTSSALNNVTSIEVDDATNKVNLTGYHINVIFTSNMRAEIYFKNKLYSSVSTNNAFLRHKW